MWRVYRAGRQTRRQRVDWMCGAGAVDAGVAWRGRAQVAWAQDGPLTMHTHGAIVGWWRGILITMHMACLAVSLLSGRPGVGRQPTSGCRAHVRISRSVPAHPARPTALGCARLCRSRPRLVGSRHPARSHPTGPLVGGMHLLARSVVAWFVSRLVSTNSSLEPSHCFYSPGARHARSGQGSC